MKRTDLEKLKGLKITGKMHETATPGRYGKDAASGMGRRERRKLDQARGVVPFAVKIDEALVKRIRARAAERGTSVDAVVEELLRDSLEE